VHSKDDIGLWQELKKLPVGFLDEFRNDIKNAEFSIYWILRSRFRDQSAKFLEKFIIKFTL
jgi:hypothetical protein